MCTLRDGEFNARNAKQTVGFLKRRDGEVKWSMDLEDRWRNSSNSKYFSNIFFSGNPFSKENFLLGAFSPHGFQRNSACVRFFSIKSGTSFISACISLSVCVCAHIAKDLWKILSCQRWNVSQDASLSNPLQKVRVHVFLHTRFLVDAIKCYPGFECLRFAARGGSVCLSRVTYMRVVFLSVLTDRKWSIEVCVWLLSSKQFVCGLMCLFIPLHCLSDVFSSAVFNPADVLSRCFVWRDTRRETWAGGFTAHCDSMFTLV